MKSAVAFIAFLSRVFLIQGRIFKKNVITFAVSDDAKVTGQSIEFSEPDCDPTFECHTIKKCAAHDSAPTLTADKKYFACCLSGQHLVGSPDTAFDCCGEGHDLAGSKDTGYRCCPTGQSYDGNICAKKEPVCRNGKALVDGKCVCPDGSIETENGACEHQMCSSGLQTAKCYMFIGETGHPLGYSSGGHYAVAQKSGYQLPGKFQLCKDGDCKAGLAVNPGELVYIKNLLGGPAAQGGSDPDRWLDNRRNGGHITKTDKLENAGKFTVTKWPCGKYCIGGLEQGLGPACPADKAALTFLTGDKQSCVPFEFLEVPCDTHETLNNCIWKTGKDQCCDKMDCLG